MIRTHQASTSSNSDADPGATVTELLVPTDSNLEKSHSTSKIHPIRLFGEIWREVLNELEQA